MSSIWKVKRKKAKRCQRCNAPVREPHAQTCPLALLKNIFHGG